MNDDRSTRDGATPEECPQCGLVVQAEPVTALGIRLMRCPLCGALWFDFDERAAHGWIPQS